MNVSEQARRAYAPTQVATQTPRSVESKLLSQVTSELRQSQNAGYPVLVAAVHRNRDLWNVLASDVADSDNGLPDMLRAQIFYLAEFTQEHSKKILRDKATVEALIDINTAVLRGLNNTGDA